MIKVNGLTKSFKQVTAVQDLSFEVESGTIYGLLGPNGAGKTTTIRMLSTILSPSSGSASINGFDITREAQQVRKSIGVLTTDIGHYDRFTTRENISYFAKLYGLDKAQIEHRLEELTELFDLGDFLDRKAGKCSTGMRQKIALARSTVHDPPVLILDEPTSGLDVLASQTVIRFMQIAKKQGKTIVLSTHNMTMAQKLCDHICIIHRGTRIYDGTSDAILQRTKRTLLQDAFLDLTANDSENSAKEEK